MPIIKKTFVILLATESWLYTQDTNVYLAPDASLAYQGSAILMSLLCAVAHISLRYFLSRKGCTTTSVLHCSPNLVHSMKWNHTEQQYARKR
jgi:hypothetical protein